MASQVEHIAIPEELLREIDAEVGRDARETFLTETLQAALQKRRLLAFLESDEAVWKEEDHPEWAEGSAAWVRSLRQESDRRIPKVDAEQPAA